LLHLGGCGGFGGFVFCEQLERAQRESKKREENQQEECKSRYLVFLFLPDLVSPKMTAYNKYIY